MTASQHKVLIVGSQRVRDVSLLPSDLDRLSAMADWEWLHLEGGVAFGPNEDPDAIRQLIEHVGDVDCVVVSHGSPMISADVMDGAPNLKIIGEMEGDRFAYRIDVESAWERGIRTVDTTHGSSYPVAEWALGLILISLRNAGASFRSILAGDAPQSAPNDFGYLHGELTGKRVGFIGCGHIGRRLVKYLRPFEVDILVYDPYLASEMPDAIGVVKTSLENVLSNSNVIVCLAPLTPATVGMIGRRELDMIPSNSVFVNVSRGAVVDSDALIARLNLNPPKEGVTSASWSGKGVLLRFWDNGFATKTDPGKGAPNRCNHATTPTASVSPSTTAAWWPMPGCSFPPPWPGISACPNSSSSASTWAMPRGGRTRATR